MGVSLGLLHLQSTFLQFPIGSPGDTDSHSHLTDGKTEAQRQSTEQGRQGPSHSGSNEQWGHADGFHGGCGVGIAVHLMRGRVDTVTP